MNIYFIAGPPGIGKSTYGRELVPRHIPIVDHDLAAYQYKKKGFADYSELASLKANEFIDSCMSDGRDFALELNLGYESHYDYVKSLATSSKRIRIHLILFFTDNVELCLLRAKVRHQNGGHLVEPHVIRTMYRDTIPSFKKHSKLFTDVSFISVTDLDIEEVTHRDLPNWVSANNLVHYVRN
ncbi:putative ABC-type ATPase [Dyadobacter jiangsuensis]|uniref:Putative ABC-type ATPase n=2 Tax=Dyadobacter jiangsuensis TaxID=1591085 RepID=A0A2P8G437_9BACT|nr:putative ABC-type ATPase [Dyadobacter jiangsuensis]